MGPFFVQNVNSTNAQFLMPAAAYSSLLQQSKNFIHIHFEHDTVCLHRCKVVGNFFCAKFLLYLLPF